MTKQRPIIMQGESVRAILAGTKTQSRRVIKPPIPDTHRSWNNHGDDDLFFWTDHPTQGEKGNVIHRRCPYGARGMKLWVREGMCENDEGIWCYAADGEWVGVNREDEGRMMVWVHHKETSICSPLHMPRWASRITLEITGVRVERLQDISDDDAIEEGVDRTNTSIPTYAIQRYRKLWDSINGKTYPWDSNPWVWVIEFKVAQP